MAANWYQHGISVMAVMARRNWREISEISLNDAHRGEKHGGINLQNNGAWQRQ